jgi:nitroreductase
MYDLTWIMRRRSVRSYLDKPVAKSDLEKVLRAGMAAPSTANQQLKEFIVIDQKEILVKLAEKLQYAKMLSNAPAAIVICGDITRSFNNDPDSLYWIMDCSAATENILLAVEALGLGAVWTAVYTEMDRVSHVSAVLGLPENIIPMDVIPIGYPAKDEPPKEKWNESAVHWNQW